MEKEPSPHKNILESIPESKLNKMADDLDWLGSTLGIEIKEEDCLIKSEEEYLHDGSIHNVCAIEGELNGKGLRISKTNIFVRNGEILRNICLWERVESEEQEGYEYEVVCEAWKKISGKREDLLSQYKRKKIDRYPTLYEREKRMLLFYEELSQEKDYKELKTLHEALEKVAITVNKEES